MTALRHGTARTVDCSFKIKLLSATLAQRVGVGGHIVREQIATSRIRAPQAACIGVSSKRCFPPFSAGASLKRRVYIAAMDAIDTGFPPFSAGASLKPGSKSTLAGSMPQFSPVFCGGLIEARRSRPAPAPGQPFSPVFCGGLIEATTTSARAWRSASRFPPFSAGASLKRRGARERHYRVIRFSPVFCGGLIEARSRTPTSGARAPFSPVFCGGLIEAPVSVE